MAASRLVSRHPLAHASFLLVLHLVMPVFAGCSRVRVPTSARTTGTSPAWVGTLLLMWAEASVGILVLSLGVLLVLQTANPIFVVAWHGGRV
jgi:hypothetical protein